MRQLKLREKGDLPVHAIALDKSDLWNQRGTATRVTDVGIYRLAMNANMPEAQSSASPPPELSSYDRKAAAGDPARGNCSGSS